jgi:hypothetical protein
MAKAFSQTRILFCVARNREDELIFAEHDSERKWWRGGKRAESLFCPASPNQGNGL